MFIPFFHNNFYKMDGKHIKIDKYQQIEKLKKKIIITPIQGFYMFLTMMICPVWPYFAVMPHISA